MKVFFVIMLLVSVVIFNWGPGVATAPPAGSMTAPIPATDGNNYIGAPVADVGSSTLNPAHGQPGHRCDIAVGKPIDSKLPIQSSTAFNPLPTLTTPPAKATNLFTVPGVNPSAGLNPPHGRPGHRCDIKVGEPLTSKPAPAVTTPAAISNSAPVTPAINTTTVAPGLNPPHGQPGHRCDIKVGELLNSKPAPAVTTPAASNTSTFITPATKTNVTPGLNPPHGQPGHRCDIKVGEPLTNKTALTPWAK